VRPREESHLLVRAVREPHSPVRAVGAALVLTFLVAAAAAVAAAGAAAAAGAEAAAAAAGAAAASAAAAAAAAAAVAAAALEKPVPGRFPGRRWRGRPPDKRPRPPAERP
jgi:hypothetical protein